MIPNRYTNSLKAKNEKEASSKSVTGVGSTNFKAPIQAKTMPRLNRKNFGAMESANVTIVLTILSPHN